MKKFTVALLSLSLCHCAQASDLFTHSFKKDLREEKVAPMPYLLKAIRKYPSKKRFILRFFTMGPMERFTTVVNVNLKTKVTYLRTSQVGMSTSLTKFTNVDERKIRQAYRYYLDSPLSPDGAGNFGLLQSVGCPTKIISNHVIGVRAG